MARAYEKRPVEHTRLIRRGAQTAFLLLNIWLGVQFYIWVRYFETGGQSMYVSRPPGVEGWLPGKSYEPLSKKIPGLPEALDDILARTLEPEQAKRLADARALKAALLRL